MSTTADDLPRWTTPLHALTCVLSRLLGYLSLQAGGSLAGGVLIRATFHLDSVNQMSISGVRRYDNSDWLEVDIPVATELCNSRAGEE
jgi:hypothetical protein